MKDKMNQVLAKNAFERFCPAYYQASLVHIIHISMSVFFLFYTIANLVFFAMPNIALLNATMFVLTIGSMLLFRATAKIHLASISVLSILVIAMLTFIHMMKNETFSFFYMALIPPLAYFLLGRVKGQLLSIAVGSYVLIYILIHYRSWETTVFDIRTIFNIVTPFVLLMVIIGYYERIRQQAYEQLKRQNQILNTLSTTDPLTGMVNRLKIDEVMVREIMTAETTDDPLSIIIGDLDQYKQINDTYGHLMGDVVLQKTSKIMVDLCRDTDTIGRWGGDEFFIICPHTGKDDVIDLAQTICRAIDRSNEVTSLSTISIGCATYRQGDTIESLVKRADKALYHSKRKGKNRITYEDMQ